MDEDFIINPEWSQRRQNRCAAFRFIFQWEMNPSDDVQIDLNEYFDHLNQSEEYFAYSIELIGGVLEKVKILDSIIGISRELGVLKNCKNRPRIASSCNLRNKIVNWMFLP